MKLFISNETTIKELNKEFQKSLPYLKLEFYSLGHKYGASSLLEHKFPQHASMTEISPSIQPSVIEIEPFHTVAELEQKFQDLGLPVQVYRKTGEIWIETTQTDNLTLEKQNSMGMGLSRPRTGNAYTLLL